MWPETPKGMSEVVFGTFLNDSIAVVSISGASGIKTAAVLSVINSGI
jgi:hypothetical protein